jgi:hypothetical protein
MIVLLPLSMGRAWRTFFSFVPKFLVPIELFSKGAKSEQPCFTAAWGEAGWIDRLPGVRKHPSDHCSDGRAWVRCLVLSVGSEPLILHT